MEPPAFVPLLLLNLADAKNPSGTFGRVLCVSYEAENRLFDDQQQAHLELALCGHTMQAVLVKTEGTCEGAKGWLNIKRTPCAESGAANSAAAAGWTAHFL